MAKKMEAEGGKKPSGQIKAAAYNKLMKRLDDLDSQLSEIKGQMGSVVAVSIAEDNTNKDALRIIRKYRKKPSKTRAQFLLDFLHMWELDPQINQPDLPLDEVEPAPKKAVKKVEEPEVIEGPGDARSREELESVH